MTPEADLRRAATSTRESLNQLSCSFSEVITGILPSYICVCMLDPPLGPAFHSTFLFSLATLVGYTKVNGNIKCVTLSPTAIIKTEVDSWSDCCTKEHYLGSVLNGNFKVVQPLNLADGLPTTLFSTGKLNCLHRVTLYKNYNE